MAFRTIGVLLTADATQLKSGLLLASREIQSFDSQVSTAGANVTRQSQIMSTAVAAGGLAVAAGLAYSVKSAIDFETAMRNVNSISHISEEAFKAQGAAVLELSTQLPQSAQTLAQGLYQIASSGFQGADGLKVLEESAKAASAGLTTTDNAATAITAVLNAYGLQAKDSADVSDVLFQTVNLGVVSFEQLTGVIGDTVGTAAAAGVGIDQVGAAIATMTLSGISAEESGTSLNRTLQAIIKPSKELSTVLHAVGYESGAQALQADGLKGVMDKLRGAVGGNVEAWLQLFPEIRAARGALALIANEGQNYARVSGEITDANKRHGATQAALDEQLKATGAQFRLFVNGLNVLAIEGGTRLLPFLNDMLDGLRTLGGAALPEVKAALAALAPFFGNVATIAGDLATIIANLVGALGPLAGLLASLAVGGAIAALNGLSTALSAVTGLLADHPAIVEAVAIAYGVTLVASLASSVLWFGRMAATIPILVLEQFAAAGGASALATQGLAVALAALPLVIVTGAILGTIDALGSANAAAKKLVGTLREHADLGSNQGYHEYIASLKQQEAALLATGKASGSWVNAIRGIADGLPIIDTGTIKTVKSLNAVRDELNKAQATAENYTQNTVAIANATGQSTRAVEDLAHKLKVDLTGSFGASEPARKKIIEDWQNMAREALGGGEGMKQAATISIDELQRLKTELDDTAKKVGEAFGKDTDLIGGFARAAADGAKASDTVTSARKRLTEAEHSLAQLRERQGAKDKTTISDAQALAHAQDKVATAEQGVASAQGAIASSDPGAFFQRTLQEAQTFAAGIAEASQRGLDPALVKRLLEAGPAQAAPFLQGVLADHTGRLIGMANQTQTTLNAVNAQVVEMARVTQRAVNTSSTQMAADFGIAMDIMAAKAALGGHATVAQLAEKLHIGEDDVRRVTGEYVIITDQTLTGPLPATTGAAGQAAADALANRLRSKVDEVIQTAGNYVVGLGIPLNKLLGGIGAQTVDLSLDTLGGGQFAQGGFLPRDARLQPPGTLVQWAEPETQGEYFIPRAPDRRPRAVGILAQAADDFGYQMVEKFATGGWILPGDIPKPPDLAAFGNMVGYTGDKTDTHAYDAVLAFVNAHPPPNLGGAGGATGDGYGYQAILHYLDMMQQAYIVTSTTGGTHATNSRHYTGDAVDLGGDMPAIAQTLMGTLPALYELIHNPGFSVHAGQNVDPGFWGATTWGHHADHVHVANFHPGEGPGFPTGGPGDSGAGAGGGTPAGGLTDWIHAAEALTRTGDDWTRGLYARAMQESGGDPHAVNNWDSNAKAGHPSKGLMQTIDGTFQHYKVPGHDDIWNPVDNMAAAIDYIKDRYGDPYHLPRGGYAEGGLHTGTYDSGGWLMPGRTIADNNTGHPERIMPPGPVGPVGPMRLHPDDIKAIAAATATRSITVDRQVLGEVTSQALHDRQYLVSR